jgi:hypothetical protein
MFQQQARHGQRAALGGFVGSLAHRIASVPAAATRRARGVTTAVPRTNNHREVSGSSDTPSGS